MYRLKIAGTHQVSFGPVPVLMVVKIIWSNADPDVMSHSVGFYLALHCVSWYLFTGFKKTKGSLIIPYIFCLNRNMFWAGWGHLFEYIHIWPNKHIVLLPNFWKILYPVPLMKTWWTLQMNPADQGPHFYPHVDLSYMWENIYNCTLKFLFI